MQRNDDAHDKDVDGVVRRLRAERPEASPLDLDRILRGMKATIARAADAMPTHQAFLAGFGPAR